MRILTTFLKSRHTLRLAMLAAVFGVIGTMMLVHAAVAQSLTVVNNSSREIRHLYLSSPSNDNWGPDQLNNSPIAAGVSRTLNISWEGSTVKLVAEDQDGCFMSTTVSATSNIEWTITAETSRNCGN